jgi:hypothetical protein
MNDVNVLLECWKEVVEKDRFDNFCNVWGIDDYEGKIEVYNDLVSRGYTLNFELNKPF